MSWRPGKRIGGKVAVPLAAALTLGVAAYGLQPAALLWTTAAQADDGAQTDSLWLVQNIEGDAQARRADGGDDWFPLRVGQALEPGSEVRTDPVSHVALISGREVLDVAPDSQVQLPAVNLTPPPMRVIQWFGDVIYEVGKRPAPNFQVDTPHLAAVVKGTKFTVKVDDDGSVVAVSEGIVSVAAEGNRSRKVDVTAGVAATVLAAAPGTISIGPATSTAGTSVPEESGGTNSNGRPATGGMQASGGSAGDNDGDGDNDGGDGDSDNDNDSGGDNDNDSGDNDNDNDNDQ